MFLSFGLLSSLPGYPRIRGNFLTRRERSRRRSSRRGGELSSIRGWESGKWKDHLRWFHWRIHRFLMRSNPSFFHLFRFMDPAVCSSFGARKPLSTDGTSASISGVEKPVTGALNIKRVCHWFDPIPRIVEAFLPGREAEW